MPVNRIMQRAGNVLQRMVLPPRCLCCGQTHDGTLDVCAACQGEWPPNAPACIQCAMPLHGGQAMAEPLCGQCLQHPPPFALAAAPWMYSGAIASLLTRFKFHAELACGRMLATLALETLADWPGWNGIDLVVPVPLHEKRLARRGYNQALELARPLAHAHGFPLAPGILQRTRDTPPQTELSAEQRHKNLRGAFTASAVPEGASVLLIDDVFTTGATLREAAKTLRKAGAAHVRVLAMARVP